MTKKIYSLILVAIMMAFVVTNGLNNTEYKVVKEEDVSLFVKTTELNLWYTDDALTDYLTRAAQQYQEESGVRVSLTKASGIQYLEEINDAVVSGENAPDLYIISNDMLEKAFLSNLATPILDPDKIVTMETFSRPCLSAVVYNNRVLGYPLYFETSIFLYNKTYMHDMAKTTIENERNQAEGEAAQEAIDAATSTEELEAMVSDNTMDESAIPEEEIQAKVNELIPNNLNQILSFAESYDAPDNVEAVFKWDVSDIFYNYFIVGDSISVGGENGDNINEINIYNQTSVDCMTTYQELNQFFSIDSKAVSYEEVLQDFINGKIVFTIATTDAISKLATAKDKGEFAYEYAITDIPSVSDSLSSRSLSVTNAIAINGFSNQTEEANTFASYLISTQNTDFYTLTDKIPSRNDLEYENAAIYAALDEYAKSIPMTKMMKTSNFWAQLEIAFTKIWNGADVKQTLSDLDVTIRSQIAGYQVEPIVLPEVVETEAVESEAVESEAETGVEEVLPEN